MLPSRRNRSSPARPTSSRSGASPPRGPRSARRSAGEPHPAHAALADPVETRVYAPSTCPARDAASQATERRAPRGSPRGSAPRRSSARLDVGGQVGVLGPQREEPGDRAPRPSSSRARSRCGLVSFPTFPAEAGHPSGRLFSGLTSRSSFASFAPSSSSAARRARVAPASWPCGPGMSFRTLCAWTSSASASS